LKKSVKSARSMEAHQRQQLARQFVFYRFREGATVVNSCFLNDDLLRCYAKRWQIKTIRVIGRKPCPLSAKLVDILCCVWSWTLRYGRPRCC